MIRRRWVLACVAAEAIGMTAAAAAARGGLWLTESAGWHAAWALAVIVAGGLVEGLALGTLQARVLTPALGSHAARRWTITTLVVAGLGWAGAAPPAALAEADHGTEPALGLVLLSAAVLGATMGALLGVAQAWAARTGPVAPWRWVGASTAGWALAMPVIFLGATAPGPEWTTSAVVLLGTVTGAAAGAVLGAITSRSAERLFSGAESPEINGHSDRGRKRARFLA